MSSSGCISSLTPTRLPLHLDFAEGRRASCRRTRRCWAGDVARHRLGSHPSPPPRSLPLRGLRVGLQGDLLSLPQRKVLLAFPGLLTRIPGAQETFWGDDLSPRFSSGLSVRRPSIPAQTLGCQPAMGTLVWRCDQGDSARGLAAFTPPTG